MEGAQGADSTGDTPNTLIPAGPSACFCLDDGSIRQGAAASAPLDKQLGLGSPGLLTRASERSLGGAVDLVFALEGLRCGCLDPWPQPMPFPGFGPDQYDPCCLHEQNAQVAIAASGDFAEDRAVTGRDLLGLR